MGRPHQTPNAWHGWTPLVALPALVALVTPADVPAWGRMWLLAGAVYAGCKWLTWRRRRVAGVPAWRHLAYLAAWPGLDADAFLCPTPLAADKRPAAAEWLFAAVKLGLGVALVAVVVPTIPAGYDLARGWVGMAGIVLGLHFGALHLVSCAWRAAGVDARPLMCWPIAAAGVGEFWGRRWNTAFRDLAHRFLFRPLTRRLGPGAGLVAGFVFSGLVHDLVISVPAGAGLGLPTAYFALQAPDIRLEHSPAGRALGLGRGWRGRAFAALVVIGTAGLLFHPPFIREVILPFLAVLGAA
jgi:hypothetical protein